MIFLSRASKFADVLDYCQLTNIGMLRGFFTWRKTTKGQCQIVKRLDRVLANVEWGRKFPKAYVKTLHKVYSDNHLILLHNEGSYPHGGVKVFPL